MAITGDPSEEPLGLAIAHAVMPSCSSSQVKRARTKAAFRRVAIGSNIFCTQNSSFPSHHRNITDKQQLSITYTPLDFRIPAEQI